MQIRIINNGVSARVYGGQVGVGRVDLQMREQSTMPEETAFWVCLSMKDEKHELNYLIFKHSPLVKVILKM